MELHEALQDKRNHIEAYLNQWLPETCEEPRYPQPLLQAMRYSLLAGGKRLRPCLTLLVGDLLGAQETDLLPLAAALEMIHTYSLIHDDLPAMDDDDLRRGVATCHVKFGEALAILAGDALLTEAFAMLAALPAVERLPMVLSRLSYAAGYRGMVGGQAADMAAEHSTPDVAQLQYIHTHKTGDLIESAVVLPGIALGMDQQVQDALAVFGRNIGYAFQIVDDILDETGTQAEIGKPVGSDRKQGKVTYPALHGISRSREEAQRLVEQAKQALNTISGDSSLLSALADYIIARSR